MEAAPKSPPFLRGQPYPARPGVPGPFPHRPAVGVADKRREASTATEAEGWPRGHRPAPGSRAAVAASATSPQLARQQATDQTPRGRSLAKATGGRPPGLICRRELANQRLPGIARANERRRGRSAAACPRPFSRSSVSVGKGVRRHRFKNKTTRRESRTRSRALPLFLPSAGRGKPIAHRFAPVRRRFILYRPASPLGVSQQSCNVRQQWL